MAEALSAALIAAALKKSFEKLVEAGIDEAKLFLSAWKTRSNLTKASEKFLSLGRVKTLWQVDQNVDIREFFVPPTVTYGDKPFALAEYSSLPAIDCLVIEGLAGHGKSIVLRNLALTSLRVGRIPIFIQAFHYSSGKSLLTLIREYLTTYGGVPVSEDVANRLLESGICTLLVDGFDEVAPNLEGNMVQDLQGLSIRYGSSLRIIVTSRPSSAIQKCPEFSVVRLLNLTREKQQRIIEKLSATPQDAVDLNKALNTGQASRVEELLMTPLMVVILVVVYRAERRVPETLSAFFDNLFWILLSRHDGTKPGFSRHLKAKLGQSDFRRLFEAFCFFTRRKQLGSSLNRTDALTAVEDASKLSGISTDAASYLDDVRHVTCLMIEEGLELHFLHGSIQEYFSARFVATSSEDGARNFYTSILVTSRSDYWLPELQFLKRIDSDRFHEVFFVPALRKSDWFPDLLQLHQSVVPDAIVRHWLDCFFMQYDTAQKLLFYKLPTLANSSFVELEFIRNYLLTQILNETFSPASPFINWLSKNPASNPAPLGALLENVGQYERGVRAVNQAMANLSQSFREASARVARAQDQATALLIK